MLYKTKADIARIIAAAAVACSFPLTATATEIIASDNVQYSDMNSGNTIHNTPLKILEITIPQAVTGSIRVSYDGKCDEVPETGWCFASLEETANMQLYKDGAAYGTLHTYDWDGGAGWGTYSQDFTSINYAAGTKIQVYVWTGWDGTDWVAPYVKNLKVMYDNVGGSCAPPGSGDWTIAAASTCTCNTSWTVPAHAHIYGTLDMQSPCNITFTSTGQNIYVYPGGTIYTYPGAGFNK